MAQTGAKMKLCLQLSTLFLLLVITSVLGFDYRNAKYDKGPNVRQTKQYVSQPYSSLKEECSKSRRIVEHCHKGKEGVMQYTECDFKTNFWRPTLRVIKCVYPKTKCIEHYSKEMKTEAECIDGTTKPSFPKTGTISWKGTVVYDAANFYWRRRVGPQERTAHVYGKVWLDDKGNFYQKELKVDEWPGKWDNDMYNKEPAILKTVFSILSASEDGKFIQFKGSGNEKISQSKNVNNRCKRKIVGSSYDSLSLIWKLFRWYSKFKLQNRKKLGGGIEEQIWVEKIVGEEWDSTVTWKLKYNEKTGFAVPISMEWVHNDDEYGRETERYEYHYQPLRQDDKTVDPPPYC